MNQPQSVTLLMSEFVTHDVKRFVVSRPPGFEFTPGQGVELAIKRSGWTDEARPFTPTGLEGDRVLEFTIKCYPDHAGMTRELHTLDAGAELLMSEPFGTISYQGPGVFIAGGAGITPFLAILRERARANDLDGHALIFSNKAPADIVCEKELRHYLGERCLLLCTRTAAAGYLHHRIDRDFLTGQIDDFGRNFYVCGPPAFMEAVNGALEELGANPQNLVFER
ncbi:MAG TPA: FAD-binding oxidoreductase [Gammaproteobacteria bacterium]|nr:FAD-binding oxidoreductase [Gammaproteobacteria bacterium]